MASTSSNRDRLLSQSRPNAEFLVHPATMADLEDLSDVLALSFHPRVGMQALVWPVIRFGIREDMKGRLQGKSPKYCCLGAWVNSDLVGTLEVGMRRTSGNPLSTEPRSPYIANLAVLPHWRRQGVATRLLSGAEAVATSWGGSQIYLHVLESNPAAHQLYLNAGYRIKARQDTPWKLLGAARQILLYKPLISEIP